jgi:GTP-binding protein
MNWQNSHFLKSITDKDKKPQPPKDEIAVIGRSNVGKSSLINALLSRKKLAKVSRSPGKTQLINYFSVDNTFYLVDLPGYGYARVAKMVKERWKSFIESYLKNNLQLKLILLLIDCRHDLMESDLLMYKWLNFYRIPYCIILTKRDKLSKNRFKKQENKFKVLLKDATCIPYSVYDPESQVILKKFISTHVDLNNP